MKRQSWLRVALIADDRESRHLCGEDSAPGSAESTKSNTKRAGIGLCLRDLFVVVSQEFFGVVVGVGAGLPVVEVCWGDPFGVAVVVFAGGPALFGELVVGAAAKSQVVDIGDGVGGVAVAVMDLAQIARHAAAGERTPTILGVQHDSLR